MLCSWIRYRQLVKSNSFTVVKITRMTLRQIKYIVYSGCYEKEFYVVNFPF